MEPEEKKYRKFAFIGLTGVAVFSLLAIFLCTRLELDYDFESFFPKEDPETAFYFEHQAYFETDNDWVIVSLVNEEGIFEQEFLQEVDRLTDSLKTIENVEAVTSPTQIKEYFSAGFGPPISKALIQVDQPNKYAADSARIFNRAEFIGTLFSTDGKALSINLAHKQKLSKFGCDTLSYALQDMVSQFDFDESHLAGRSIGQTYYVGLMQTELIIFVMLSIVLIISFLWIAFRSSWGVWVPLLVVLLSVVWLLGFMQITGKKIDLMLTVMPTIIFVVGMSDVVHILARYFEELRTGTPKLKALTISFKEIGLATLLTSITTAIGFLTLLTSRIEPIKEFGLYVAVGVFLAFILAYTVLPAILVLKTPPKVAFRPPSKVYWTRKMRQAFLFTINNKRKLVAVCTVVLAVSIFGISKVEINNFLLEDLKDDDPLKQEFMFFEDNFAGARPFEVALEFKDDYKPFNREALLQIEKIDAYLEHTYGVGSLISPAKVIKNVNLAQKGNLGDYYKIPETQAEIDKIVKGLNRFKMKELVSMFVYEGDQKYRIENKYVVPTAQQISQTDDDGNTIASAQIKRARISGKVGDLGGMVFMDKDEKFQEFLDENIDQRYFEAKITGTPHLIDINNKYLAKDMVLGLVIAFGLIALVVGIMFRSLRMIVISLVPNILPLIIIGGIMGYFGIYLKVSTAIIFTIAFGIAVDDTIHFLTKFRLQLAAGRSKVYALKRTYISTGKAIIITTLILCGGFLTLIISDFLGTFYVGLLISLTMLFAVLADLFLLPILILWFFPDPNKPKELK